jgi:hypothetical protein
VHAGSTEARDGGLRVTLVDGLYRPGRAVGPWPDYYAAHRGRGALAVELRGRGLVGAVFLEGVVLEGAAVGKRFTAEVPYLPRVR